MSRHDSLVQTLHSNNRQGLHAGINAKICMQASIRLQRRGSVIERFGISVMEKTLFDDLVQSLEEARAIAKGEALASRRFEIAPLLDVKTIRERTELSQGELAQLMRVSEKTIQRWERHQRKPSGPAVAFLKVLQMAPEIVIRILKA